MVLLPSAKGWPVLHDPELKTHVPSLTAKPDAITSAFFLIHHTIGGMPPHAQYL